ncbi:AAA family ATPase [Paraburkholderia sp. RP-4-7]|uniref:AAA family ATPase n=1 Tax=Paraburkholderia polaris TaxID=2728848 RepID=A0A848IS24_9BURK|nr:AAA family ATPase [Paraburkholderia polaris]NMM02735.1 AAA family ATPase [Paraburkholderia polaris]
MKAQSSTLASVSFEGFRLDTANECLWRLDSDATPERIDLTRKTFGVLRFLIENRGALITHDALLEAVWPDVHVQPEVVKAHIRTIRARLGDSAQRPRYIETLRGRGYRFVAPVEAPSTESLPTSSEESFGRFTGRTSELQQLSAAMDRARSGNGQVVVVAGEPGIGKTALLKQFVAAQRFEPDDAWVAEGHCVEGYGGTEPFYPVLQALGQLCQGTGGSEVVKALVTLAPTWAWQLPGQVAGHVRESLHRQILAASRERMLREIRGLLSFLTQTRPLLLIFEDLHWADYSTIDFLAAMARQPGALRLMIVATYRPDEAALAEHPIEQLHHELSLRGLCRDLALGPLPRDAVVAWLTDRDHTDPAEEELSDLIAQRCGGNPLFMRATLADLVERNMLRKTATGWRPLTPLAMIGAAAPHTITRTLEGRIRRLPADERNLLEAASVAGLCFSSATVAEAAGLSTEQFDDLCEALARNQRFIQRCAVKRLPDGGAAAMFCFDHALIRNAFYGRQGLTRRSRLHRQIAQRLEAIYARDQRAEVAYELGQHFADARDWLKAIDYLRIALQTAKVRFAYREAQSILDFAASLTAKLPAELRPLRSFEFAEARASLYAAAHDPRAEAAWVELEEQARTIGRLDAQLRAMLGLAYVFSWSDRQRCIEVLNEALTLSASHPDLRVSALVRVSAYVRRIWTNGWSHADLTECETAMRALRETGDPLLIARANLEYSMLCIISTRYREALGAVRANFQILFEHAVEHPGFDLARATWMLRLGTPWAQLFLGELGQSMESFEQGMASFRENGDYFAARTLEVYRGWLLVHTMDYESVIEMYERFVPAANPAARAVEADPGPLLPVQHRACLVLAGLAYIGLEDGVRAASLFAEARRQMDATPIMFDWYWRLSIEWGEAEAAMMAGDHRTSRLHAQAFLKLALATEDRTWQALAWELVAREALESGDPVIALDRINSAFAVTEGFETPLADWRLYRTAAAIHEARGNAEQADVQQRRFTSTLDRLSNSLPRGTQIGRRLLALSTS